MDRPVRWLDLDWNRVGGNVEKKSRPLLAIAFLTALLGAPLGIPWERHPSLTWDDFKGRPGTAREPSAVTDTGFRTQLICRDGLLDLEGGAEFYPNTSWVKPDHKLDRLLTHEQGHFDITELFTRRMKKAIRDARIGCEDESKADAAGRRILSALDEEWVKTEKAYDHDTKDGTDAVSQNQASARIARDLAASKSQLFKQVGGK